MQRRKPRGRAATAYLYRLMSRKRVLTRTTLLKMRNEFFRESHFRNVSIESGDLDGTQATPAAHAGLGVTPVAADAPRARAVAILSAGAAVPGVRQSSMRCAAARAAAQPAGCGAPSERRRRRWRRGCDDRVCAASARVNAADGSDKRCAGRCRRPSQGVWPWCKSWRWPSLACWSDGWSDATRRSRDRCWASSHQSSRCGRPGRTHSGA